MSRAAPLQTLVAVAAALAVVGCAGEAGKTRPSAAPARATASAAGPTAAERDLASKQVAALEEMGRIADQLGHDCERATEALKPVVDRDREALIASMSLREDQRTKAWYDETYRDRLSVALKQMMPMAENCNDHEAFKELFRSLDP